MKTILFLLLVLAACTLAFAPARLLAGGDSDYTLAPDGTYVSGDRATLAPDGTYVGGTRAVLTPSGKYVGDYNE